MIFANMFISMIFLKILKKIQLFAANQSKTHFY